MKHKSLFYLAGVCIISSAMVLILDSPLILARIGSGGNIGGMPGSSVMLGQGGAMGYINNSWGITNTLGMDYPWNNWGQSGWGNMLGMMTNVDAYSMDYNWRGGSGYNMPGMMTNVDVYSGYSYWGDGGGYNIMDLMKIINQSYYYMDIMNQLGYCSGCYIPPPGQASIQFGPERIILPKITDTRGPSPIPIEDRYWPGYAAISNEMVYY